jgi:Magnesium chelatase, subunit ChlI
MPLAEAFETTRIHRVAGLTGGRTAVVTTRPFRAPHHTISDVGLIDGGQVPLPGEVSPAHHGVLFNDEVPGVPPPRPGGFRPAPRDEYHKNTMFRTSPIPWHWLPWLLGYKGAWLSAQHTDGISYGNA